MDRAHNKDTLPSASSKKQKVISKKKLIYHLILLVLFSYLYIVGVEERVSKKNMKEKRECIDCGEEFTYKKASSTQIRLKCKKCANKSKHIVYSPKRFKKQS